jgi:hypothetical protein
MLGTGAKKSIAASLGAMPPKAGAMEEPDDGDDMGGAAAMQDFMDAQKAGDAAGAFSAFKSMVALCGAPSYESEDLE